MAEINVTRDSKLIKVLAAQANRERLDSNVVEESNKIIMELAQDMSPANRHQIAQTVAFTVDELQKNELAYLNNVADIKNIAYGDKAAFNVKTGHVKAYYQAKGSTTARSMVGSKQILVGTDEISARPAINVMDLRTGRVNMGDLIREANLEMTNMKNQKVQNVLVAALATYQSPFYAAGTGIVKNALDAQINHFRRFGNVTLLGDISAVSKLAPLAGMAFSNTQTQHADSVIVENNNNGFIGKYNGCDVVAMDNAFAIGTINPMLKTDFIYIIPAGMSGDTRNLKLVNEGPVQAFDSQNIDDLVYEIRLDQWLTEKSSHLAQQCA